jgi:hypothetical protein
MAQQSLKNLDSFSRGYIEDVRSNVDFDTTRRSESIDRYEADTTIQLGYIPVLLSDGSIPAEVMNPLLGKVVSGKGIVGAPRVIGVSADRLNITIDQPQSFGVTGENTILTFSDTNSGIDQYELTGSAKARSKEDIRIEDLVPEELLEYATESSTGGIRDFLESYYKFMNLEEFTYKDEEIFEDVVIDNTAIFRINEPNKFFQRGMILAAQFFDEDGVPLLVGDEDGSPDLVGDNILLDDSETLAVGSSYQIISLGNGTASNIAAGINNISGKEEDEYFIGDIFVASNDGTGYDATLGSEPVNVRLLDYPEVVDDIFTGNISISNSNKLPGRVADSPEPTGRTVNIYRLSPRLNKRKITMKTFVYNYIEAGPSYRLNTMEDSLNLMEAHEEFLDLMQKEIAPALDKTSPVDKRAVYEKIIDFYKMRGSFESIETFFKLLYNEQEIQVNYPWDNTLKPSAGVYDPKSAIAANYTLSELIESSDNANNDTFGRSVSVSGDTFVASSPRDDDNQNPDSGAVYTYETADKGKSFVQKQKIVSATSDADTNFANDKFGTCVSLSSDNLVISAPGDETTYGVANTGSVEIWNRAVDINGNSVWSFNSKIIPAASTGIHFAHGNESVSLDGEYLAVGHVGRTHSNASIPEGSVNIYKQVGSTWQLKQELICPSELYTGSASNNGFGETVVIKGDYLVVSFQNYSTASITKTGRVVVYKKNAVSELYEKETILAPTNDVGGQTFGYALDISVVEGKSPRVALTSRDNPYHTVYIFERSDSTQSGRAVWHPINSIPSYVNLAVRDSTNYGIIVRIFDDQLIIGEQGFDDVDIIDNGKIYHYEFDQDLEVWNPKLQYRGDPVIQNANYGFAIDISDEIDKNYLVVGAPGKPDATGNQKGYVRTYDRPALSGNYTTNAGFLSEKNQKVHDSDFYQKFSYVVKVARNISQWSEPFSKLVHPAGFKYFGEVLLIIQAVRNVLGDSQSDTTVGIGQETQVYENSYSASPAFRKTMSSMPGIQPGYIGIEDIGLLVEAIASTFGIVGIARPNKDAKLSMKPTSTNGGLIDISIPEPGFGYPSNPAVTLSGAGSGATAAAIVNTKGEVTKIRIFGGHNSFNITDIGIDSGRTADTYTNITTGGSRSSANGDAGIVTIEVGSDKGILSITSTTTGNNYEVGERITIPAGQLGSGSAEFSFTVASCGSGYLLGTTLINIQTLAQDCAGEGLSGDQERVFSKIGVLNSTTLGLDLVGLNKKTYTQTPSITISAPNARESNGDPLSTNVQATATLTRNPITGRITGYTITNPGSGYLNDATIIVSDIEEKRAPDYMHKKIIPANHDKEIRSTLPENDYYKRKNRIPVNEYNVHIGAKSDGTGNAFYINTIEAASLTLVRGATYRFIQSDVSNINHPFRLSLFDNGIHTAGAEEYTVNVVYVGTPGTEGAYTEIKISPEAPDTLFYYCTNHIGMGSSLNIFGKNMAKENPSFLGQKKFQGNYQIHDFDNITIEDIYNSTADGTSINNINAQASLSDAITNKIL